MSEQHLFYEDTPDGEPLEDEDLPTEEVEEEEDELSKEFVNRLVDKIMQFMTALVGYELHPYQAPLARRIIESVIINDGEEVTALQVYLNETLFWSLVLLRHTR